MGSFGDFTLICERAYVPLCAILGPYNTNSTDNPLGKGLLPGCYARSIILANTMIFNVGNCFIQFGTIFMVAIAIYNSYGKYTAVGRREMLDLFYLFFLLTVWSLVIDSGVVPASSATYPYFVAIQAGFTSAFCLLLTLTGFLGYQLWEDGSKWSVWGLRGSSTLWGIVVFIVAIITFQENKWHINSSGIGPSHTVGLMVVLYVINAVLLFFYACLSLYLTVFLLRDWWATGAYILGGFMFAIGQVLMYGFGSTICDRVHHYIDGIFFATICNMIGFLMIYKAWDITTQEDLEFSVSNQEGWNDKADDLDVTSEYALSNYNLTTPYL